MSISAAKIGSIIKNYPGARITASGNRTIEQQIAFVKSRPSQYPSTLKRVFEEFKLDKTKMKDEAFLKTVYNGKDEWLKKTILDLSTRMVGFQHLSGNAIDVSVNTLTLADKENLKNDLEEKGYHVIMEAVAGNNSKYYVPISQANVFHIDTLTPGRIQGSSIVPVVKSGSIYKLD